MEFFLFSGNNSLAQQGVQMNVTAAFRPKKANIQLHAMQMQFTHNTQHSVMNMTRRVDRFIVQTIY